MQDKDTTSPNLPGGRSNADLLRWGAELLTSSGLRQEYGYHFVLWLHDDFCPQNPENGAPPWGRCQCQPDAVLILHIGTPYERRLDIVRDAIPLPVRTLGTMQ